MASNCFNPRLPGGRRPDAPVAMRRAQGFNPRLPGGRRHAVGDNDIPLHFRVSIHAFRGEGDGLSRKPNCCISGFQSTPSGGKATVRGIGGRAICGSFNPRLPGGRRPCRSFPHLCQGGFNPRLPGGRRRIRQAQHSASAKVSIHAFRGEGDRWPAPKHPQTGCFNPRLPGGRRPVIQRPSS